MTAHRTRLTVYVVSVLLLLSGVGCGSAGLPVKETSATTSAPLTTDPDLASFVVHLQSKSIDVLEEEIVAQPVTGPQLVVLESGDQYEATFLESRVYHEAALSKAQGAFPWAGIYLKIVSSTGGTLIDDGGAVDAITVPTAASGMTDTSAAGAVRKYFADAYLADSSHFSLNGLTIKQISVVPDEGERTLILELTSENTAYSKQSLSSLILGATSYSDWVAELNNDGLGLVWVRVRVTYPTGLPDCLSVIDVARHSEDSYAGGRVPEFVHQGTLPQPDSTSSSPGEQ